MINTCSKLFLLLFLYLSVFIFCLATQRRRIITHANAKSKSEKFPPPHQDGGLGYPLGASQHIDPANIPDIPYSSTSFTYSKGGGQQWSGPLVDPASAGGPRRKKKNVVEGNEPKSTGRRDISSSRARGK